MAGVQDSNQLEVRVSPLTQHNRSCSFLTFKLNEHNCAGREHSSQFHHRTSCTRPTSHPVECNPFSQIAEVLSYRLPSIRDYKQPVRQQLQGAYPVGRGAVEWDV